MSNHSGDGLFYMKPTVTDHT